MIVILTSRDSWCIAAGQELTKRLHNGGENVFHFTETRALRHIGKIDVLLLLGYYKKLEKRYRDLADIVCAFHESALPHGRGWAPLTWQIIEGSVEIPVTLFEVIDEFDAGDIYLQEILYVNKTDVIKEIRRDLTELYCNMFIKTYRDGFKSKTKQTGTLTYYQQRTPSDSELDPSKTINEQFNLLRICDPIQYPAFFIHKGKKYILKLEKG